MNKDPEMGTITHKREPLVKVAIPGAMLSTENRKEEQSFDGVRIVCCVFFFYSYSHHWLVTFSNMKNQQE